MQRVTGFTLLELPDSPAPHGYPSWQHWGTRGRAGTLGGRGAVAAEARLEEGMTGQGKKTVLMWQRQELLIRELASSSGSKKKCMRHH